VAWRVAAVTACVTLVLFAPGVLMRTKRMGKYVGFNLQTNVVNVGLGAIAAFAFGFCAFGLPTLRPSASYLAGLIALLLNCTIIFFRVIASLLRPHAPE